MSTDMEKLKNLHHWDVLAVSCIDGRFVKKTIDWVAAQTDGVFDFRTEVGSSKAIIDSPADRERFFDLIITSKKLHNIKELWIIDHVDCGAYGGSSKFNNIGEEKEFHKGRLTLASKIIADRFPTIKVKTIFVDWGAIEEI